MSLIHPTRSRGSQPARRSRSLPDSTLLALGLLTVLLIAPLAVAESPRDEGTGANPDAADGATIDDGTPSEHRRTATSHGTAGLRVFVNPTTGELTTRPSEGQVQRFQQSIDQLDIAEPVTDLHPFPLRDGGTGAYVGNRFMTSTVVRRAPDGSLALDCTTDPDHLLHRHPPLAPAAPADTATQPETARRASAPVM